MRYLIFGVRFLGQAMKLLGSVILYRTCTRALTFENAVTNLPGLPVSGSCRPASLLERRYGDLLPQGRRGVPAADERGEDIFYDVVTGKRENPDF